MMLCGYDKQRYTPGVVRIFVHKNQLKEPDYDFCLLLGGETREIQRLIFGTDTCNRAKIVERTGYLLERYRSLLAQQLEQEGIQVRLKEPEEFGDELKVFHGWGFERMTANWSALSEQSAIECVEFFIRVVIQAQKYSTQIPSVGGEPQVAIVKKNSGFAFVSKREWHYGGHAIPMRD